MKKAISNVARIAACALALAVIPAVMPASAQTNSNMNNDSAMQDNGNIIPGTGMTAAELQDIGYSQQQISQIQNDMLAENNAPAMNQGTNDAQTSTANNNPNAQANTNPNATNMPVNNAESRGGWGLWGLVGLLGLLGLAGRRKAVVRDERDRDVRRIA